MKANRITRAQLDHERFLKKVGYTGQASKKYKCPVPDYTVKQTVPTSDKICAIPSKKSLNKVELSQKYTIAPAYNKGPYALISKNEIKDIGKK